MASYSRRIIIFMLLCFFCKASFSTQNNGFSVELIHHDSVKSPFYNPAETQSQRVLRAFHYSINRATYLYNNFHFLTTSTNNNLPATTITPYTGSGCYLMSFSVGTPPIRLYGAFDTGSELTWFLCKPCEPCLNQSSLPVPIFDPSKSLTFRTLPCSDPKCKYAGNCYTHKVDSKEKCQYDMLYGDGTYSQGDIGIDILTLNSSNASSPPISFPRTLIGCGHNNTGESNGGSGIVGFGTGPLSLPSQLGSSIGGRFSYCFVPLYPESTNSSSSTKLSFGDEALVSGLEGSVSTSLLLLDVAIQFYPVNLESLSVEDKVIIKWENSSNYLIPGKPGNVVIDTGSTFTYLPNDVYYKLESAVASMIKLKRVKDPTQQLRLCYETTSKQNLEEEVPIITAHFTNADVQLNAVNTFIPVDNNVLCFAFLPMQIRFGIFGNIAQQNFLVGFDLLKGTISFKPMDCTKY